MTGARSIDRWQEAKEEVVQGQGYAITIHPTVTTTSNFRRFPESKTKTGFVARSRHTQRGFIDRSRKLTCVLLIVKDKAQHAVVLDKTTAERLNKDVQSYRLITVATLVDRLKINGSLARQALADLESKGTIKKVVGHSKMNIYSAFPTLLANTIYSNIILARAVTAE